MADYNAAVAVGALALITAIFPEFDKDAFIGACCGGIVVILIASEVGVRGKFLAALISTLIGYNIAEDVHRYMDSVLPIQFTTTTMPAFMAGAVCVFIPALIIKHFANIDLTGLISSVISAAKQRRDR